MKKFLLMLMCAATLCVMSCASCNHEKVVFNGYNIDSVIAADQETVSGMFGSEFAHYECQVNYQYCFDSVVGENLPVKVMNVFQYMDTSCCIFHFADANDIKNLVNYANGLEVYNRYTIDTNKTDYTFTLIVNDFWLEDQNLCFDSVAISFDSAYKTLMRSEIVKPHSDFVVMRQPLTQMFPNRPYYIFGNILEYVAIDSHNGDIVKDF